MTNEQIGAGITRYIFSGRGEWLRNRKGIGGSDAASIVNMNPYKDNQTLWREKAGLQEPEDISGKPYVKYGHDAEPLLRNLFALNYPQYTVDYFNDNLIRNDKYPWAHASLDGELTDQDGNKGILEVKTATINSPLQADKWKDKIPDNYYIQCLHYLMVTGYEFVRLTALLRYEAGERLLCEIRDYDFERNEVLEDIEYLKREEKRFWDSLQKGKQPGLMLPEI